MTARSLLKGAVPVALGVAAVALAVRYFGDQPIIEDIRLGLKGDLKGSWFS